MKKLLTITLALCAVIVAMACGSNDPDVDGVTGATVLESLGIAGVSIRDASSKQTVENWLKKLGVDKQSTAINHVRTRTVDNGVSYSLNGMPSNNQRGLYIKNGKKYVSK